MPRSLPFVAAGLLVAAVATPAAALPAPRQATSPESPATATGRGGAVASTDTTATAAGIEVLRAGGNAVDAAVATAATLGVTQPFVAGPGGGGYLVVYLAKQKRVLTIDGRETCPRACTPSLFVDPRTGKPLAFEDARRSGLSVGVPGMVAQWALAVRDYGRLSLARDLEPAIRVAERGFTVDADFRQQEQAALPDLQNFTSSRSLFLKDGKALPVGYRLRNPDLARTYRGIAQQGPGFLYGGRLAATIARTVAHPPVYAGSDFDVRPGALTTRDLADYSARIQQPTHITYRGLDVYGMAPSSSGGITVGEALNILGGYDLGAEPRAQALFHYLEASRLAFADRNAYIGDARYEPVPQRQLLSPTFAASRRCLIESTALASPAQPGDPYDPAACGTSGATANPVHEGQQTNHLTTADRFGNVVSYTNTIEQIAGSGITVPGYGFLLNNELTDFDFAPATPNTYDPNLPAPGKRPRSSMAPTIVLENGRPAFALGSPGGSTIITTVLQVLIDHVDFGMSLPAAIAAPRVSQRNATTSDAEPAFYDSPVASTLTTQYGEKLTKQTGAVLPLDQWIGDATGIDFLSGGRMQAAAEPVRLGGGSAMVVDPGR